MSECTKRCEKCIYSKKFNSMSLPYCDYLCMTGKIRPCPAGDGCTVRTTRKEDQKGEYTPEEKAAFLEKQREKQREKNRKNYLRYREKKLAYNKAYYQTHREERNAYQREWRRKNKEG